MEGEKKGRAGRGWREGKWEAGRTTPSRTRVSRCSCVTCSPSHLLGTTRPHSPHCFDYTCTPQPRAHTRHLISHVTPFLRVAFSACQLKRHLAPLEPPPSSKFVQLGSPRTVSGLVRLGPACIRVVGWAGSHHVGRLRRLALHDIDGHRKLLRPRVHRNHARPSTRVKRPCTQTYLAAYYFQRQMRSPVQSTRGFEGVVIPRSASPRTTL